MKLRGKFLLLLSLFNIMACTGGEDGNDASNSISFVNKAEAQKSFESVSIRCGEENLNCPEHAAGVSVLLNNPNLEKPWNSQVCSGTLIDHNKILTNDHCLGTKLIKEDENCNGKVRIIFPQTKTKPAESFECSKIHRVSAQINNGSQRPDWVILELEKSVSRKTAIVNIKGLDVEKKVKGYPVFYSKNETSFDGTILSNTCTTTMKHYFSTYYFHPHSAIVTAAQCSQSVIPGTSGTGYFNSNNELKFIGSFSVDVKKGTDYQEIKYHGQTHQLNNKFVGGTNVSCIPELNPNPSTFCYFSNTLNFIRLLNNSRFSYALNIDHKESLNQHRLRNSHVKWKMTDQNSLYYTQTVNNLNERYNKKPDVSIFEYNPIPNAIIDFLALKIAKVTYPLTPICLSTVLLSSKEVEIPNVEISSYNMLISEDGFISYPNNFDLIKVSFSKGESELYEAELLRMDLNQRVDYLKREQAMATDLVNCRASGENTKEETDPCLLYSNKKDELNKWMTDSGIESYLRRNEITALSLGDKEFDLSIPSCSN